MDKKVNLDKIVNPPILGDREVLCPPITSVDAYMKWLRANRKALKNFFGK